MPPDVQSDTLKIGSEDDVVAVRRRVRALAERLGFDSFATAAVTTATSELTRNVWMHAGGGEAQVSEMADGPRRGIRIEFRDRGPGIPELERALAGGYSTRRSMGLGLAGSRRLVDEFSIDTKVGEGTTVRIEKWIRG